MMHRLGVGLVLAAAFFPACASNPDASAPDGSVASGDAGARSIGDAPPAPTRDAGHDDDLGASVTPTGVTFRLWAPHATAVSVIGDFPEAKVAMKAAAGGTFETTVSSAHPGTRYAFALETPSGPLTRIDPYCRSVTIDRSACFVVDPSSYAWHSASFTRPSRESSVVYEMHVGSFTPQGTLQAARARLAELADLGVNVVELLPVHAFGGTATSWGYNPHLWLAPKPEYGSPEDLRGFVDDAHALGIAVWIDVVVNHADGWNKAPLRCFDGFCPGGDAGIFFFGPGAYEKTPWGPRPDYTEPEVARMFLASVEQWLTEYKGDGFRWDSVSNIRGLDGAGTTPGGRELLTAANDRTHALGGTSVAEDLKGYDAITKATSQGGFGFDAQWDGFGWTAMNVVVPPSDDARDMGVVERALQGNYAGDPFARLLWLENHDTVGNGGARLPVRIDGAAPESLAARRRDMLAATWLLTTPGVPMLFMGQESLATSGFINHPDPLPAPTAAGAKIRAFYKDAIALRRSLPDLAKPSITVTQRNDAAKVVVYRRGDAFVVLNFRNKAYARYDLGVAAPGPYHVRLDTESKAYGDDLGDGPSGDLTPTSTPRDNLPFTLSIALPPYAAVVLTP